ncbi:putative ferredoxin reductase [Kordiimonas sediminis]|uniref:Ferredoxin reductase n=1 Tax=Kordiimonas sediminis TaxID=1735581 RepID=A0A919AU26_9PROT|nr:FAD-dependent oxidoreductase [Kordiimonas sediminis]GHF23821.1 putative ferredoxin reductase [Kordiimonas sediminis]
MADIVIIGGGHAAAQIITSLRQQKFNGSVALVSEEPVIPYQRPPLSKGYLSGELAAERLPILRDKVYADMDVDLYLGVRASSVDAVAKTVTLADGVCLPYGNLILATGGHARHLPVPGADKSGIHTIRTIADVDALKVDLQNAENVVIVGGGYIGLEAAAIARHFGKQVTLLETEDRILARVTAPQVSEMYTQIHTEEGVTIQTGQTVTAIEGADRASAVVTAAGERIEADIIIVGIGLVANTDLADTAGVETHPAGIVVDDTCRTSVDHIYAVGDVTWHHNRFYNRWMRLESVQNAVDQAKIAVQNILGVPAVYDALPWFWSDQYGLKLQMAGLGEGYDQIVVRGDPATRSAAFFYLRDGKMIAADCVSRVQEFMQAKKLILAQTSVDALMLADDTRPFKEIVAELLY